MIIPPVDFMNKVMTSIERSGFVSTVLWYSFRSTHQLYSMGTEVKKIIQIIYYVYGK